MQQLKDCGCESHLEEQFADGGLHDAPISTVKASFSEFTVSNSFEIEPVELCMETAFNGYLEDYLPCPLSEAEFRPPIL